MKKNNLKQVVVNELGIVAKGAVDREFAIYKSADFVDENVETNILKEDIMTDKVVPVEKTDIEKAAEATATIAELQKSIIEKDEKLKAAEKAKVDAEKKAKEADDSEEAMEKSVADLKKNFEEQTKLANEASDRVARLEDIAKAEIVKTEVRKSMASVAGVTTDELAVVLKAIDERQLTVDEVATIKKALTSSSAIIEKSALFRELGSSRGDEPSDPLSMANAYADSKIAKADGPVSADMKSAYRAEYWDAHPDQYAAYISGGR
jgi:ribosomal protein L14E/L6E/L27E